VPVFREDEEKKLLEFCGLSGADFSGVDEGLKRGLLRLMYKWRWEQNQKDFELRHRGKRVCKGDNCG